MIHRSIVSATLLACASLLAGADAPALAELEAKVAGSGLKADAADLAALAKAYEAAGRPLEAATTLERSLTSGSPAAERRRLGRLWEAAGRFDNAALAYKAGAVGPDGVESALAVARVVEDHLDDRRRALAEYIAIAKTWPDAPQARDALIRALAIDPRRDELRELRAEAEDLALARFPADPVFASAITSAARRMGERKQADQGLAAVRRLPESDARLEAEAELLERAGKAAESATAWERRWTQNRDARYLQWAAEAVQNADKPRSARLWLRVATEHPDARWPSDVLQRAFELDRSAITEAKAALLKAYAGNESRLAVLALFQARVATTDRAALGKEAIQRDAASLPAEVLAELIKADPAIRTAADERAKIADRGGWQCRLALGLALDDDAACKAVGEAIRDGGLLDGGTARRVLERLLDRLGNQRSKPTTADLAAQLVRTTLSSAQHGDTVETCRRIARELLKDKAQQDQVVQISDSDPVARAMASKGHAALIALIANPPAGLHPLALEAMRLTAFQRAMDRRETAMDAANVARDAVASSPEWALRWASALLESRERIDKGQIDPALAALAPFLSGPTTQTSGLRLAADLHLLAGRTADAATLMARITGDPATWDRATRWTAASTAAAATDRAAYERILDGALGAGDMDQVWSMTADNRLRVPEEWKLPLAERAIGKLTQTRPRVELQLWLARARRDGGDNAAVATVLAKARSDAGDDLRLVEGILLFDLDSARRRRDAAAEDTLGQQLLAHFDRALPAGAVGDWRGIGDSLRTWLTPRLDKLPAQQAEAALTSITRCGNEAGLWALSELMARQRPRDPILAALTLQRTIRTIWRDDRENFDRLLSVVQAEAAAGRAGIAAGAYAQMAVWFNPERVGQDRIDQARRLAAEQLARTGTATQVIDDKDPKAPLLRAAALLASGDEDEAWRMVRDRQALLEEHLARVPADLALLAAKRLAGDGRVDIARRLCDGLLRAQTDDKGEGSARARLLLGELAFREEDYPSAQLEFQQVIATWPKSRSAMEAQLRLGDCLLAARQPEQARKIYESFTTSEDDETRIRAHARLAMLEVQAGDKAKALELFRAIAAMNPPRGLADELYLDWGRTLIASNRLQEAEEVLTLVGLAQGEDPVAPGEPLRITLRDPFLQTSQARSAVPVVVRTASGDEETVDMTLSQEAKGVFAARIPTALGAPAKGDRVLQVRGGDTITYDYTEDFKRGRRVVALGSGGVPIASDAQLKAGSSLDTVRFAGEGDDNGKDRLEQLGLRFGPDEDADLQRSASRTYRQGDQLKPGNPIYLAVLDADRDVGPEPDRIPVILQSSGGDRTQVDLLETGPHTGLFQGEVATGLRPADIAVSDSAPGSDPLTLLTQPGSPNFDQAATAWIAAGDRKPGKTVTVDLKQATTVDRFVWSRGTGANDRAISSWRLEASRDGRWWVPLHSSVDTAALSGAMRWTQRKLERTGLTRSSKAAKQALEDVNLFLPQQRDDGIVKTRNAEFDQPTRTDAGAVEWIADGRLLVPTPGRYEFAVRGSGRCWIAVNDRLVVERDRDEPSETGEPRFRGGIDLLDARVRITVLHNSEAGLHGLTLLWRRPGQTAFEPIPAIALDDKASAKDVAGFLGGAPATVKALTDRHGADIALRPIQARFLRLVIDAWKDGDAPALASIQVSHGDQRLLPAPGIDYAALANDQTLELSAGDEVTASYRDEKTKRRLPEILRSRLTATYFDGFLAPLEARTALVKGELKEELFPRWRFKAGETIAVRVTDYDADTTNQPDRVPVKITSSAGSITVEAVETGRASGEFQAEVRTRSADATGNVPAGANVLLVQPGEQVQLTYQDQANVNPGSPSDRTALLREVVPSDGKIAIVSTREEPDPSKARWIAGEPSAKATVVLAPLQIQVHDPDAMISAGSRVRVRVRTARGAEQDLLLAPTNETDAGLFSGSIALVLGSPADGVLRVPPPGLERGSALPAEPGAVGAIPMLPVAGGEAITVQYLEGWTRTMPPAGLAEIAAKTTLPTAEARLATAGKMRTTEDDFETPVTMLHIGGKLCVQIIDPDADTTDQRDTLNVAVKAASGDTLTLSLGETEGHSGIFTGSAPLLRSAAAPDDQLQVTLGDTLSIVYAETGAAKPTAMELPVAKGHDAALSVFAKRFADDQLAVRTQLRLAESWFEIYKKQRSDLKAMEKSKGRPEDIKQLQQAIAESLREGTALLQRTITDDPDGAQADQVLFLLGNFEQESGELETAIDRYRSLLGQFPDSPRAAEAQYKIAQCHEERKRYDDAWEAYVRLAYRWPDHELVADSMARIGLYYDDRGRALAKAAREAWQKANPEGDPALAPVPPDAVTEFRQAAAVYGKLVERFPDHRIADQIMLAQGNSLYQSGRYLEALQVFDGFLTRYPQSTVLPKGLYWAGSAALEAGDPRGSYLRYGRLIQDFPESTEAKYARGRMLTDKRLAGIRLDETGPQK